MKCRHCAAELDARLPRPGQRAAVERLPDARRRCARPSSGIRCACSCASAAGWCRPRITPAARPCSATTTPTSARSRRRGWRMPSAYVEAMRERFGLSANSLVSEVAANDGYLLRYVQQAPASRATASSRRRARRAPRARSASRSSSASSASSSARELAAAGRQVDLVAANNVLAHVPDINDFVAGFAALLKPDGVATFEFPHLLRLLRENQFDTVYHEHYSYLSLTAVERIFAANGLAVFDVEEHADPWRQPARVRPAQRHRPAPDRRRGGARAARGSRCRPRDGRPATRASRRASTRSRTTSWRS